MKKILFNDKFLLTQAVLDGRKTQTRRIVPQKELDKINLFQEEYYDATFDKLEGVELLAHYFFTEKRGKLPYSVGEVVAVAQSYEMISSALTYSERAIFYCNVMKSHFPQSATHKEYYEIAGWNNKMFVKAELMPRQIRITNVRIERLQDISDEDCLAEGIIKKWHAPAGRNYYYITDKEVYSTKDVYNTPSEAYAVLIDKVGKKGDWDKNPYVFVYDFELVK